MNEFLSNVLLICHRECGNERKRCIFLRCPNQGSHMMEFLLLSLKSVRMVAFRALIGKQLISNEEKMLR